LRKLEEAGFRILFHVHDEVIVELPEERAIQKIKEAEEIMRVPPDWIPSLPVDAEGNVGDTYAECK
jgi:DNA polymerase I - 3''-5'' exonuclease and polymerase domains